MEYNTLVFIYSICIMKSFLKKSKKKHFPILRHDYYSHLMGCNILLNTLKS